MPSRVPALLVAAVLALVLGACGSGEETTASAPAGNGADRAFVEQMIPHHRGAVQMAQLARQRAESDYVRGLADEIIAAQNAEIETLQGIAPSLEGVAAGHAGGHGAMEMEPDLESLRTAQDFDTAFLGMMIPHHESAIEMARVELEQGENDQLRRMADSIVRTQQREITEMRAQLRSADAA